MYQTISKKISVNLITGALGAGKTTLLRNLLEQKPLDEKWVLLVNEFGAVGIDGAILSQNETVQVEQIPGGCICCTAQSELQQTVNMLLESQTFDRLLIEPTGLGEPDALVDLLQSELFSQRFDIQSVFAVFDSTVITVAEFEKYTILQNLAHMADIIVFNKQDIAFKAQTDALLSYAENLYPPKQSIVLTEHARIDIALLNKTHQLQNIKSKAKWLLSKVSKQLSSNNEHKQLSAKPLALPYAPLDLPNLQQRIYHQDLNTQSIGWIFEPQQVFDWTKIHALFQSLNLADKVCQDAESIERSIIKRAKGVLELANPGCYFNGLTSKRPVNILLTVEILV